MKRFLDAFRRRRGFTLILALLLIGFGLGFLISPHHDAKPVKAPVKDYAGLASRIKEGKVAKLNWNVSTMQMTVTDKGKSKTPYVVVMPNINGDEGLQTVLKAARQKQLPVDSKPLAVGGDSLLITLLRLLPMFLILLFLWFFLRHQLPLGKSFSADLAESPITFADVAGCGEAVEELSDIRAFLGDPKRFERLGAKPPKGVILHGPPGTGKTLLAKAVANEAGVPFFEVAGAQFNEMYVGVGSRRIRDLFKQARNNAPCIVFIDEIDAVGQRRGQGGDGASREADNTLTQLLRELDGFSTEHAPIVVMAATNRLESLDGALLRPGRFDRHIPVDAPDKAGRLEILNIHARDKKLAEDVHLERIATETSNMTGAQLAGLLNEAALICARRGGQAVNDADLQDAYFRVIAGPAKHNRAMSERERRIVAYHEAGHALVGERLTGSDKVHKISIIPRGASGGQTLYVSEEDAFLYDQPGLHDRLATLLAGRAAEKLVFDQVTSGAHDDLRRASDIARKMVSELGMGKSLGLLCATDGTISEDMACRVDEEAKELLDDEFHRALAMLDEERAVLDRIAEALLEEETLNRERFLELVEPQ